MDESGNLGDRSRSNCYLVVGSRVNDRDGFVRATKKYNADHEMKFSNPDDAPYRGEVLADAAQYVDEICYVYAFKPMAGRNPNHRTSRMSRVNRNQPIQRHAAMTQHQAKESTEARGPPSAAEVAGCTR